MKYLFTMVVVIVVYSYYATYMCASCIYPKDCDPKKGQTILKNKKAPEIISFHTDNNYDRELMANKSSDFNNGSYERRRL